MGQCVCHAVVVRDLGSADRIPVELNMSGQATLSLCISLFYYQYQKLK